MVSGYPVCLHLTPHAYVKGSLTDRELFTDAGKYVIHFGNKPEEAAEQVRLSRV